MSVTINNCTLIGFFELLTLIFVIAKLTGYLTWSWFWMFSPVIIHAVLIIAGFLFLVYLKSINEAR